MKLVIIFGPQSVGKMTVGQELAKVTGLKLFHNHMTIDLVSNFFAYGTEQGKRLVSLFRKEIFEEVAKSQLVGMIFTYVWAFDEEADRLYIEDLVNIFRSRGSEIYFVELEAPMDIRLLRNTSPNRLEHKPTKRNTELSERLLREHEGLYRMNSLPGEITEENYLRIDNSNMAAEEAAWKIKNAFSL